MLATLPVPDRQTPVIYFFGILISLEGLCTWPLWLLCRNLWRRRASWIQIIACVTVLSYTLAYWSDFIATALEFRLSAPMGHHPSVLKTLALSLDGGLVCSPFLLAWSAGYFGFQLWKEAQTREQNLLRAESLAREAQLRLIRSQLSPHFLMNALNGVSTLIGEHRERDARKMVALIGDFLRTTLGGLTKTDISLNNEIEQVERLLAIERIRFGDRLQTQYQISHEAGVATIPRLLLQPLVENAIRHGVALHPTAGQILIYADVRDAERLVISISNTTAQAVAHSVPGSGMGLELTRERLLTRFGSDHKLSVFQENDVWTVAIELPFERYSQVSAA